MALKILIVEDEVTAARRLQRVLIETKIPHEVVAILDSVEDTVNYLKFSNKPDLILSDIHLSDGNCFNIFKQVEVKIPVIFTTAYDQYAINAFKVNSIGYLLKPINLEELKAALLKFRNYQPDSHLIEQLKNFFPETHNYQKRFVLKSGNHLKVVDSKEIALFYAEDKVVFAQSFDGSNAIVDFSLDKLESILDPALFFRINRKVMLNVQSIKIMSTHFRGKIKVDLVVQTHVETFVSAEKSEAFKQWLEKGS